MHTTTFGGLLCNLRYYAVEDIIAEHMAKHSKTGKSEKEWLVDWKEHTVAVRIGVPSEDLNGCEQFISCFHEGRVRQAQ